jgi:FixJ family two-component response regulator
MVLVAIVDDDPSVRKGLDRLFTASGYRVNIFASAEEFLLRLPESRPDCLILDRQMGGMSGDELVELLYAKRSELPTVIISGLVEDDSERDARKESPAEKSVVRLAKPFSAEAMFRAVQAVMDRRSDAHPSD